MTGCHQREVLEHRLRRQGEPSRIVMMSPTITFMKNNAMLVMSRILTAGVGAPGPTA